MARLVRLDTHRNGHDSIRLESGDRRRFAPVDDATRQMPYEVDDERPRHALEQLRQLRADAGERGHRRKQLIEEGGTHKGFLYTRTGTAKGTE